MKKKTPLPKTVPLALILVLSLAAGAVGVAGASQSDGKVSIQSGTVAQTSETKYVRSGPGITWSVVGQVDSGSQAMVMSDPVEVEGATWVKVRFKDGTYGWTQAGGFTSVASVSAPSEGDLAVTMSDTYVRSGPSPTWEVKGVASANTEMTIVSGPTELEGYTWYKVEFSSGATGWVTADSIMKYPWTYTIFNE